jgi:hypothetical protein
MPNISAATLVGLLGLAVGGSGLTAMHLQSPRPSEDLLFLQSAAVASPKPAWPRSEGIAFYTEWLQLGSSIAADSTETRVARSDPLEAEEKPQRQTKRRHSRRDSRLEQREPSPSEALARNQEEGGFRVQCLDERCRMKRVVRVPFQERESERNAYTPEPRERTGFFLFRD